MIVAQHTLQANCAHTCARIVCTRVSVLCAHYLLREFGHARAVYVGTVAQVNAGTATKCGGTYEFDDYFRTGGRTSKVVFGNCFGAEGTSVTIMQDAPLTTRGGARYLTLNEFELCGS